MPSPFDPSYAAMLGIDPNEMRMQQIAQALMFGGAGLVGGRNWGEGLSQGLYGAGQGALQARENAVTDAVRGFQLKKYQDEEARAQAAAEAVQGMKAPGAFDPGVWKRIVAADPDKAIDIWGQIMAREPERFTPNVETIYRGSQAEQGYFDQDNNWVKLGEGQRFEGPQAPQLPATATTWDPNALGGKGAHVYAPGTPLAGQIYKPGGTDGDGTSATERIIDRIQKEAEAAGKPMSTAQASQLARGAGAGDQNSRETLAQNYADALVGRYNTDPERYKAALAEGRSIYGADGGGGAGGGEIGDDPLDLFSE